jgi:rod shape determining protein RodA
MKRTINVWTSLDWITVFLYLLLIIIGWFNIYAAVYSENHQSIFDMDMRYGKQMIWIIAALLMAAIIMFIDTRFYTFFAYVIYGLALILLLSVVFIGKEVNGARSWFELGGFKFQPTEFAKVATCLALSKYLSSYGVKIEKISTLFIVGVLIVFPVVLIMLQPDIGSVIVYFSLIFVLYREGFPGIFLFFCFLLVALFVLALILSQPMILIIILIIALLALIVLNRRYVESIVAAIGMLIVYLLSLAVSKIFHLNLSDYTLIVIPAIAACIGAVVTFFIKRIPNAIWVAIFMVVAIGFTYSVSYLFNNFMADHQKKRVNILLGKESDLKGAEYNVNQSKIAIGSGGFAGKGFLQGTQTKYNFVPEQSTDFIFCTVGEEWGFLGSLLVLGLFAALLLRILLLAERQRSSFGRIYGYGVASILFFHVAINVGMTIGILPVIGIPLPFFSYGGSSLWAFTILLFVFLRFDASRMELLH